MLVLKTLAREKEDEAGVLRGKLEMCDQKLQLHSLMVTRLEDKAETLSFELQRQRLKT